MSNPAKKGAPRNRFKKCLSGMKAGKKDRLPKAAISAVASMLALPAVSQTFTHDDLNRLTQVDLGSGHVIQYVYDAAGNLKRTVRLFGVKGGGNGLMNDTGVTQCYQAASNALVPCSSQAAQDLDPLQDGAWGRDTVAPDGADGALGFSYQKVAADGTVLPDNASQWACVQDKVSGLLWEAKTADGGLHDRNQVFTNLGNGGPSDVSSFANAVNQSSFCGRADWRVPGANELLSLVWFERERNLPMLDTDWFPNTVNDLHWTSSITPQRQGTEAMFVGFGTGDGGSMMRTAALRAMLVSGNVQAAPQFVISADGSEAADSVTGLVWRRCLGNAAWTGSGCEGSTGYTHEQALRLAAEARSDGKKWRLPNVKELVSIMNRDGNGWPMVDSAVFPGTPSDYHWTSTPLFVNPGIAWTVYFGYGSNGSNIGRGQGAWVRLVRDAE